MALSTLFNLKSPLLSIQLQGNGAKFESKTTLVKRGEVGPCPAVRPAGLIPKLLTKFSSKSSLFSEKQNVDPRVHLPRCLQAELHLFSRHCLWCYWGMKGILDPFFRTSAHATQAQVVIHLHCSLNEDLTPWPTTYGRPRTRGNCGRSDPAWPIFNQLLKFSPLQDIRHKYENKEEEEEE